MLTKKVSAWKRAVDLLAVATMVMGLGACTVLFNSEELNPEDLPLKLAVNTTNQFYTSSPISFTGNPASDFGVAYKFGADAASDVKDAINTTFASGYLQFDVRDLYVAFDENYLYIGHETPTLVTGSSAPNYMGAMMIVLDNGLTNGEPGSNGVTNIRSVGYGAAGISGDLGLDNMGIGTEATNGKVTLAVKHWRVQNQISWAIYGFNAPAGGVIKTWTSICSFYNPDKQATGVTEIKIPWAPIYSTKYVVAGSLVTPPSKFIKLALILDPTLDLAGGRDIFPDQPASGLKNLVISKWTNVRIGN